MVKILKQGFYTSIQDFGRFGCQQYGVPYSGVMDRYSAGMANMILGNKVDLPVIEITMVGPVLEFKSNTFICLSGADMSPMINEKLIRRNKVVRIKAGDVLSFGVLKNGLRSYLAVFGGFNSENVLGSKSMYKGVTKHFFLLKNDIIKIDVSNSFLINKNALIKVKDDIIKNKIIEVFKGPEFDKLSEEHQRVLMTSEFTISKNNSRMAYQLEELLENCISPIITSPVIPGTVQLTPSGQLIILMRDCQTTGGYPRVLQLSDSAINCLSQKFTGDKIRFEEVGE